MEKLLDTRVVVSRGDEKGDFRPYLFEQLRDFPQFLPRCERDAMLDVPQEHERVRLRRFDAGNEPVDPLPALAPDMDPVAGEGRLDSQVQVPCTRTLSSFSITRAGPFATNSSFIRA